MKQSVIIEKLENLSLYFSCLERQVKDMNSELLRIANELILIKNCIGDTCEKEDNN
jgi:hypothetical protein